MPTSSASSRAPISASDGVRRTSTSTNASLPPPALSTTPIPQRVSPGSTPRTLIERMFGSLAASALGSAQRRTGRAPLPTSHPVWSRFRGLEPRIHNHTGCEACMHHRWLGTARRLSPPSMRHVMSNGRRVALSLRDGVLAAARTPSVHVRQRDQRRLYPRADQAPRQYWPLARDSDEASTATLHSAERADPVWLHAAAALLVMTAGAAISHDTAGTLYEWPLGRRRDGPPMVVGHPMIYLTHPTTRPADYVAPRATRASGGHRTRGRAARLTCCALSGPPDHHRGAHSRGSRPAPPVRRRRGRGRRRAAPGTNDECPARRRP